MTSRSRAVIDIQGARTNNLQNISLKIPHNKFIVVTGISGSGKSSLVFDIIAKEGQRRYFETLPSFARQFLGKLNRPDVDKIEGLSPVIAIGQSTAGMHARSTVGTMSDIYDLLRLLYARTGSSLKDIRLSRALFSFNSELGKCKHCKGIGKEEKIDLERLIINPEKSIRQGALAPTLPNGYIMYSQVTIDVLNQVCEAEGFNVDIPWNDLNDLQRNVILNGSNKIKVPFGKHSLESRLKWTGIKAKPREEGFYKGMIPIMSDILRRDRNANILKYVHSLKCSVCNGARLNKDALAVLVQGKSISELVKLELNELKAWIESNNWGLIANEIITKIKSRVELLEDLGLGHLSLDRSSKTLRASEIQRIRLVNQILVPLSDVLYVFDEPSIGLHPEENERLIYHLKQLVNKGNTVIVVEHDIDTIKCADHIIEIGPQAGINGGKLIFNGSFLAFTKCLELKEDSPTFRAIKSLSERQRSNSSTNLSKNENNSIQLIGCQDRNLKNIDVEFKLGKLNIVSGKSGVGKSSLIKRTLVNTVKKQLGMDIEENPRIRSCKNIDLIKKLVFIDHSPIGRTPRSNPATYLGLSDHIRDIYAGLEYSKTQGFTKSRFSFNNKGGRCENCQGAGKTQIGMHFLGNVELICGICKGNRFNDKTLQAKYKGLSIADCYKLSIDEAITFFSDKKKLLVGLNILKEIGLGYITLGQSSTSLSGGEAQRIKIANQLQKRDNGNSLYVMIEPSIGLHHQDILSLLSMFERIKQRGNTIICIEQDETIISSCDWHIELGPKSGKKGGTISHQAVPKQLENRKRTFVQKRKSNFPKQNEIILHGIRTHGLKNIDVCIPKNKLTVVTGLSGSGKSSLVHDTLLAEALSRFNESLSSYNRSFINQNSAAKIASYSGLSPAIGIHRKPGTPSKRSTVGTLSGIYDVLRLLYSRIAQHKGEIYTAQHFSFNHHLGACVECKGLGVKRQCDPNKIIVSPSKSVLQDATSKNKAISYYTDLNGQFMATLQELAKQKNWNLALPWRELKNETKEVILYGTGETIWNVNWEFNTKSRTGTQSLSVKWLGLCTYIDDEYQRKLHNKNIKSLEDLLHDVICPKCKGSRLKLELLNTKFLNKNIHELAQLSIKSILELIQQIEDETDELLLALSKVVLPVLKKSLKTISELGLAYLSLDRAVKTLSGGERQRLSLASQLSAQLFGVTYILDEPTIGLDQQQVTNLLKILKNILANGNTVVIIEHDPFFIKEADYLIEMGPGAGKNGGEVIFQGITSSIDLAKHSITYKLLHNQLEIPNKKARLTNNAFGVHGALANNLKGINVRFHSHRLIALTGVSGSGKTSLIKNVLYASWKQGRAVNCDSIYGMEQFKEVLLIDQELVVQNRLSTLLSFTGIIEQIKSVFAKSDQAKQTGLKKADFSYLSKKGKCTSCAGQGALKISMDFMSDIWLRCDLCQGERYNQQILTCKINGLSIGEVLKMTVEEAINVFKTGIIVDKLNILKKVGIGHLVLGQSAHSWSGGEAQRLKLAKSMLLNRKGACLYIFDEPSIGLHYFDILGLLKVFQSIVDRGDTVLFIEHNSTMIESANQIIKLGPGSGPLGGKIVN